MKNIRGKVALVTGGAMGMGKLFAQRLGEDGARVVLWDLNEKALKETEEELRAKGYEVFTYVADVSDPNRVRALAEKVKEDVGVVQILFNNAGVVFKGLITEQSDDHISKTFDINVKALCWTMRAFLPGMIERSEGHVVNIASASGLIGVPALAAYAASKWAVIGLSESVRYEVQATRPEIQFTIACPSYIATGMFAGVKPPRFTKMLTPEMIVDKIYRSFKHDRLFVLEPWLVKITPLTKAILPAKLYDSVQTLLGVQSGMNSFVGHG